MRLSRHPVPNVRYLRPRGRPGIARPRYQSVPHAVVAGIGRRAQQPRPDAERPVVGSLRGDIERQHDIGGVAHIGIRDRDPRILASCGIVRGRAVAIERPAICDHPRRRIVHCRVGQQLWRQRGHDRHRRGGVFGQHGRHEGRGRLPLHRPDERLITASSRPLPRRLIGQPAGERVVSSRIAKMEIQTLRLVLVRFSHVAAIGVNRFGAREFGMERGTGIAENSRAFRRTMERAIEIPPSGIAVAGRGHTEVRPALIGDNVQGSRCEIGQVSVIVGSKAGDIITAADRRVGAP